ncbi:hypothetical protein NL676_000982, partial [Syzygium grande]
MCSVTASNAASILIPRASNDGQARLPPGTRCGADPATSSDLTKPRRMTETRDPLFRENRPISYNDIHNAMADGFNLSYWVPPRKKTFRFCFLGFRYGGKRCISYYYDNSSWGTTLNVALSTIPNVGFVFAHFLAAKFIFGAP